MRRAQILELQRELRRYTTAALALGMPSTKARDLLWDQGGGRISRGLCGIQHEVILDLAGAGAWFDMLRPQKNLRLSDLVEVQLELVELSFLSGI